ncbi:adipokinetic hormone/corazonin-related peptide receptor variant I-like isoform X8 [Ostrea edulis]|uniref:adipokinetic hormone/corazonin-related peptide receptor variant I-like isoform X8 n=1 Tax=Ostrea edulis TaxID=37623 RepID=UPI0024AF2BDE|nr:adipokinetic hormone/corazonin-related peptide receptor variant I-like isoform X8 [Ostrea edulis]
MDGNLTDDNALPDYLKFSNKYAYTIITFGVIFLIGALGNIAFFVTLLCSRNRKSPTNFFLIHLSTADLLVMFVIPVGEMIHNATVAWRGGNFLCKLYRFLWNFGQNTTTFLLCSISIDRFLAFVFPLKFITQSSKTRSIMAGSAWVVGALFSIPESVIFHVETHPKHKTFTQCVTFNFFPSDNHELAYNLFNLITLYALPLLIITTSYSLILWEISKKTKQCKEETKCLSTRSRLRRSSVGNMERARIRTLKMTLVIVSVFVVCWTPYFVLSAWWWFDRNLGILTSARGFRAMTSMLTNTILGAGFYGVRQSVRSQSTEGPVSVCRVQFLHGSYCLRHVHYHLPPGNSKMGAVAIASVL